MSNRIEDLIEKARHFEDLWHEALDDNKRLKAEVERLTFDPLTYLDDHGEWMPRHIHLVAVERLEVRNAELVSENARLKAEVETLKEAWVDKKMQEDRDALLLEVERLRKAGDAMASSLGNGGVIVSGYILADEWLKAKCLAANEGKPSV